MKNHQKSTLWIFGFLTLGTGAFLALFHALTWLLRKAPEPIGSRADLFVEGAYTTLSLTIWAGLAGLVVGVFLGLFKLSRTHVRRYLAGSVIWILRGTPLLVQIMFVYYALPALIPILRLSEYSAALLALAVNVGAYNAEVIRAGILAVPKGQSEAAHSLGLSKFQTMALVILPQALRIVIPPLVNNFVALLKDSSLASSIGLLELTLAGNRISSETFLPVPVLTTVAFVYLVLTSTITTMTYFLERKMRYS